MTEKPKPGTRIRVCNRYGDDYYVEVVPDSRSALEVGDDEFITQSLNRVGLLRRRKLDNLLVDNDDEYVYMS